MKSKSTAVILACLFMTAVTLAPFNMALAAAPPKGVSFPVQFTGTSPEGAVTFVGTYTIQKFVVQNDAVAAVGVLTGNVTGARTGTVTNQSATIPLFDLVCEILHLELGPIDLTLLGLMVHVDKIVIDITAQPGGGLLGDLLCAIANLLDMGVPLNIIADLLNALLDLLMFLG
jgi:hypothetical protein